MKHLLEEAHAWIAHARAHGSRLDLETRAVRAICYSAQHEARTLCLPSKLEGTSETQRALAWIEDLQQERLASMEEHASHLIPLSLHDAGDRLEAYWQGEKIGHLRPKHTAWARPLVAHGLRAYITAITGGGEKGYRGCNIILCPARAIERLERAARLDDEQASQILERAADLEELHAAVSDDEPATPEALHACAEPRTAWSIH